MSAVVIPESLIIFVDAVVALPDNTLMVRPTVETGEGALAFQAHMVNGSAIIHMDGIDRDSWFDSLDSDTQNALTDHLEVVANQAYNNR